ncbi:hypothetical protein [Herpetosiphon sp. NSE202]|uniref:hypothetical protein n=1 Tax=Herpetosiphon sp. NSE202 TaxID=3351349 RepID=UPI00363029AE
MLKRNESLAFGRPFLITVIAIGYVLTALVEIGVALLGRVPAFLQSFILSEDPIVLVVTACFQIVMGLALFQGWRIMWWVVIISAYVSIGGYILDGLLGERWAWGGMLWNVIVLAYMNSRDVEAFFGREVYY